MLKIFFMSFFTLFLNASSNKENINFNSNPYPLAATSDVSDKSYILYETPLSENLINKSFNRIVAEGIINDPNVIFEMWIPRDDINLSTSVVKYSVIRGELKVYKNGRFWVFFDVNFGKVSRFKIVVINNGVKKDKFNIEIYEVQPVTVNIKRDGDDQNQYVSDDKTLSLPDDLPFKFIRRSDWNAKPPSDDYTKHIPQKITIHHTAGNYPATYDDALSEIQFIQDYHQNAKGWIDIGYHFLIDPQGDIFEGRPVLVVGAHVANKNTNNVGISIMGNYHPPVNNQLTDIEINSIITLVKYIKDRYSIVKENFYAHRDLAATDCPGDIIYSKIPYLKEKIFDNSEKSVSVIIDIDNTDLKNSLEKQLNSVN
ncbi:MAG: N-acetylmuramoyl-L-alanine amidase [Elusimicrobiales bacterium]|jgi:hypothetical protein|nr:N-acetylmuramoyl-L-alanine amidase [Elusimicrobiales bacterium]